MKFIPLLLPLIAFGQGGLLPPPKAQFLNADGTPMIGGKVCTYLAGTTTPAQTYTDASLTVANANPIVLDSRGEATIFLDPNVTYKVSLRQPGGVNAPLVTACSDTSQVYSVDNIAVGVGGGGGGGGSLPVDDTTAIVRNAAVNTKQVRISAASVSPFTTRVLTMPDQNLTAAGVDVAQTFTQTQRFSADILPSPPGSWNVGSFNAPFAYMAASQFYVNTKPTGLCNYAGMAGKDGNPVLFGGVVFAQDPACTTQSIMDRSGFDTGPGGNYKIQGTIVIGSNRILSNINSVGTNLVPSTAGMYDLGSTSLPFREAYVNNAYVDAMIPNVPAGSLIGTSGVPYGSGVFDTFRILSGFRYKGSTTAGWILTATDAAGNADWAAPPTGTLPSQTGNAGRYLTTDGTNASWAVVSGSGISSLGGQTGATQTFANDTNVTISSAANVHTLGWTGQLAPSRGGTGLSAFTRTGNTTEFASWTGAKTSGRCVQLDASGNLEQASAACGSGGGGGLTSLNGQNTTTFSSQTFATGTSGTDFNITSAAGVHFFNIPDASGSARGLITTGAQSLAGAKTLAGNFNPDASFTRQLGNASARWDSMAGRAINLASNPSGTTASFFLSNVGASGQFQVSDTGAGLELRMQHGATDFLANSSSIVMGRPATTVNIVPDASFTRDFGGVSARWNNIFGRNINLQATGTFAAGISLRGVSGTARASFTGDDAIGGEFSLVDASGATFFSAVSGNVRYNNNAGQTTTVTVGACTMTFNQGGLTAKSGGC